MGVWQGDPLPIPLGVSAVDMGMASISNTMVHCASTSVAYTLMMIKISISLRLPIFNLLVILTQVVMLMSQVFVNLVNLQTHRIINHMPGACTNSLFTSVSKCL